jgi:hypothetical protein
MRLIGLRLLSDCPHKPRSLRLRCSLADVTCSQTKDHGKIETCRHCGNERYLRSRRLCRACYERPAIRDSYEPQHRGPAAQYDRDDLTDAELDAMIAEQLPTMPTSAPEQLAGVVGWSVPVASRRYRWNGRAVC